MEDHDETGRPQPRARTRPRRWRLLAAGIAGAVTLGLASPAGALIPEPELDTGVWWQPPQGGDDVVSPATPEPVPTQPGPVAPAPAPQPALEPQPTEPSPVAPAPAPPEPSQGETAQQRAERQLQEAIDDVRALLADPVCAAFIGGTRDEPDHALDVFNSMVAADNPRAIYNTWSEDYGNAWAIGGRLYDEGGRPVMQLFRRFHEVDVPVSSYNRYPE